MVFSVQQGEHGPLVVYKLAVPDAPETAARSQQLLPPPAVVAIPPADAAGTPPAYQPGPLQPTILGTVVLPASTPLTSLLPSLPPPPAAPPATVQLIVPDYEAEDGPGYRVVTDFEPEAAMLNEHTGKTLTLDEVHDAIIWRRETAEKLRDVPFAPRF